MRRSTPLSEGTDMGTRISGCNGYNQTPIIASLDDAGFQLRRAVPDCAVRVSLELHDREFPGQEQVITSNA